MDCHAALRRLAMTRGGVWASGASASATAPAGRRPSRTKAARPRIEPGMTRGGGGVAICNRGAPGETIFLPAANLPPSCDVRPHPLPPPRTPPGARGQARAVYPAQARALHSCPHPGCVSSTSAPPGASQGDTPAIPSPARSDTLLRQCDGPCRQGDASPLQREAFGLESHTKPRTSGRCVSHLANRPGPVHIHSFGGERDCGERGGFPYPGSHEARSSLRPNHGPIHGPFHGMTV